MIILRILTFLFVPPFRKVVAQVSDHSNHERRDAILPNNNHGGFWRLVREEFASRHVICELKNSTAGIGKDDVAQLRMYLSKRTIGRFGILLYRSGATAAATEARRNAYEQNGILMLLIDDNTVRRLMLARSFLGEADVVLEDLKMDFEITY